MQETVKRISLLLLAALLLPAVSTLVLPGRAGGNNCLNTVYVNDLTGNDAWDGSSPTHVPDTGIGPKKTIQEGMGAVCTGGTVYVAAGTYDLTDFLVINRSLSLIGAGAGSTIINGSADPEDEVIGIYSMTSGNVLIAGFTIQNGNWNGIYVDETAAGNNITINDCIITLNNSIDYGGGIWIDNDNLVTLNRCTVSNNTVIWEEDFMQEGRRTAPDTVDAFTDNISGGLGGGIAAFGGTLNLNQCTISNNTATGDSGIGGGIFAVYDTTLNMTGCSVTGNAAGRWGGGIFYGLAESEEASATINNCNISNNRACGGGGGLFVVASGFIEEYLENEQIFNASAFPSEGQGYTGLDNFARDSGQIDRDGTLEIPAMPVTLNNCTVSGNAALNWGGGMASAFSMYSLNGCTLSGNQAGLLGGGLGTVISMGALVNCTVSGNSLTYPVPPAGLDLACAPFDNGEGSGIGDGAELPPVSNAGGGIATIVSMTAFQSCTIAGNSTGSDADSYAGGLFNSRSSLAMFVNTIVANNTAVRTDSSNCLNRGTIQSMGYNIDSRNECGFNAAGDQVNTNPLLGPLADNGGPTLTCAVGANSPAFNRGDNANAPATDQRGVARPQASSCTIGAYEVTLSKSATIPVATGLGNVTFTTDLGGIVGLNAYSHLDCAAGPSYLSFPFGYFSFTIVGLTPGATVSLTISLPSALPAGAHYYKCLNGELVDCTSLISYQPGTNILVMRITDGALGDGDGLANGTIVDPGGPAVRSTKAATSHSSSILPPATSQVINLPNLAVQSASLSAASVKPGDAVTVNAIVANRGNAGGTAAVRLLINGSEEARQSVTLEGGQSAPVSFTVSRSQPGSYSVYADGIPAGSFTVTGLPQPDILLIVSATLILAALAGGALYVLGRRRHG
ncbi:MAG: choice-of-anchor U domain-containing protein [Dehalococcoidia bacterium]